MSKGSVGLIVPIIGSVITIWDKLLFKIRVSFYGLVRRQKVFLKSSNRIETHLDVFVKVFEAQSSVAFKLCIEK